MGLPNQENDQPDNKPLSASHIPSQPDIQSTNQSADQPPCQIANQQNSEPDQQISQPSQSASKQANLAFWLSDKKSDSHIASNQASLPASQLAIQDHSWPASHPHIHPANKPEGDLTSKVSQAASKSVSQLARPARYQASQSKLKPDSQLATYINTSVALMLDQRRGSNINYTFVLGCQQATVCFANFVSISVMLTNNLYHMFSLSPSIQH